MPNLKSETWACRWSAVAKKVTGRTGQQCAQRWRHKVRRAQAQGSMPGLQGTGSALVSIIHDSCVMCPLNGAPGGHAMDMQNSTGQACRCKDMRWQRSLTSLLGPLLRGR